MRKYWTLLSLSLLVSCSALQQAELDFQNDADLIRLEHLQYWTGLIEEYEAKTGAYPFQRELAGPDVIGFVNVVTAGQRERGEVAAERFVTRTVAEFVAELEAGLQRPVDEMYDIQAIPTKSFIGYNYFVRSRGYMFRVTCITCGESELTFIYSDGITPTITVASAGMMREVPKAQSRETLLAHPLFREWTAKPFILEEHARSVVAGNIRASKQ